MKINPRSRDHLVTSHQQERGPVRSERSVPLRRTLSRKALVPLGVVALLLGVLGTLAFPRTPVAAAASADVDLVTQSDVEAIFHANFNGHQAIFLHAHQVVGALEEDRPRASITPLSSHDGTHFCVDDWHLMRIRTLLAVDNDLFLTKAQVIADLRATSTTLTLDGVSLPTTQLPITQVDVALQRLFDLPGPTFQFQVGSFFSPGAISVGPHTAGTVITDPVFGVFEDSSTFIVDPSGTGACLQG